MNYALRHAALITYMQAKIAGEDWHAVSDAANDLREIEAEQRAKPMTATEVLHALPPITMIGVDPSAHGTLRSLLNIERQQNEVLRKRIAAFEEQLTEAIKWARAGHNTIRMHQHESAWPTPECPSCKTMLLIWPEHLRAGASTHV